MPFGQKKGRRSARKVLGEWWVSPRGDITYINEHGKHWVNGIENLAISLKFLSSDHTTIGQKRGLFYIPRMKTIKTYAEFWPYYLREHAQAATRGWHYLGTGLALSLLIYLLVTQKWALIPLVFVCGYFFAWVSHGLIEKNKPATFTYPFWSLGSDFKMLFHFLTGTMTRELEKAGVAQAE